MFDGFFLWITVFVIVVLIAFWPARVAHRKGHSFFWFFVLSVIFFPLALILAYVVDDRGPPEGAKPVVFGPQ